MESIGVLLAVVLLYFIPLIAAPKQKACQLGEIICKRAELLKT
ncbi:hypothetical protein [Aeromonas veronii]